jgi:short subunit dehydrogenase-like uncharacterized protein
MAGRFLIYGATGYTGRLLTEEAVRRGLDPVLAGRDGARLAALARPLGLAHCTAPLDDPGRLARAVGALDVGGAVLNAAGPFAATSRPLAAACLAAGVHYLDLAGEIEVFAALHRLDGAARSRGVMLMPGAGFIVVPSDCLAAHVSRRLSGARWLRLGISRTTLISRGSVRTMVEMIRSGPQVRRNGRLTLLPWSGNLERPLDFGRGPRPGLVVSWADVYTAYHTTGIPNVEACLEVSPWEGLAFLGSRSFAWLLRTPLWQNALKAQAELLPEGPSAAERAWQRRCLVAVAGDAAGRIAASRLQTPESYTFTVIAALAITAKVLGGELRSGFQTPAGAYGADFVLGLPGVVRDDLAL